MKTIIFQKKGKRTIDLEVFCEDMRAREQVYLTALKNPNLSKEEFDILRGKLQLVRYIQDKHCK
jgi:hypothetical protein